MPTFTVKEIKNVKPWSANGGEPTRIYYDITVEEMPERLNLGRKPGEPVKEGDKLTGNLEDDQRGNGKKLIEPKAYGGGGGGPRPRDPKESARIIRQHSQKVALMYAALRAEKEMLPEPFQLADLKQVIDWFEADAKAAKP